MNNNPHRQNGWDAFTDDCLKGLGILVAIVAAIIFPPIIIGYIIGVIFYFVLKQDYSKQPFARMQEDGSYTVYNADGTIKAVNIRESQLPPYLRG